MMWLALLGTVEQGFVYGLMAMGVYVTFRILKFADMTVDGSFPLGAAVAAVGIINGVHPLVALMLAMAAGAIAGVVTGLLHTKVKISGLLSGILTMTALYSINLRVMQGRPNIPLLRTTTLFDLVRNLGVEKRFAPILVFVGLSVVGKVLLDWFFRSELGMAVRATGDNQQMIRSLGVNTDTMIVLGLGISNALVGLSGGLAAQYQGFADVNLGIGTLVSGLASVIIGEVLLRPKSIFTETIAVMAGSIVYRLVIFFALRAGLAPTDLKLVTAVLVVIALSGGRMGDLVQKGREWLRLRSGNNVMHRGLS